LFTSAPVQCQELKDSRTEHADWTMQVAEETGAFFIPLNEMIAGEYDKMDNAVLKSFFPADRTHTNKEGALFNAQQVIKGISELDKCKLKCYIVKDH
jgi:hypothetical protein